MFLRTKIDFLFVMATSLAFLGVLRALTIDNQLTVIKSDCYERLAIGQRLNPKDVYKTSDVNTVPDCQLSCTNEQLLCKSFSFGIGIKGNATCELSAETIEETADLKPIGTIADTEFDLYIKKIGCTLVIDKNNEGYGSSKPPPSKPSIVPEKPHGSYDTPSTPSPGDGYGPSKKPPNDYGSLPIDKPSYKPENDDVQHVQTLVSISTGPQKPILHPIHDILIGEGPYNYAKPPFRPSHLSYPHDKPYYYKPKPNSDDYYDSRPYSYGQRPIPDKYGSYIPRPESYYFRPKPMDSYFRPNRPNDDYSNRPSRPNDGYGIRPDRPSDDYDNRPNRPNDEYGNRPTRPNDDYGNRPNRPNDDYGDRPNRPNDDYGNRPSRPNNDYDNRRPNRPNDDYRNRPNRPSEEYGQRPNRPNDDYGNRPNRPNDDYDNRPNRPNDDYGNRPNRPSDEYGQRPIRPNDVYDNRPNRPNDDYSNRPNRPNDDYGNEPNRPNDDYGTRPNRPNDEYGQRPNRPIDDYDRRPNRPSDDYSHKPNRHDGDYGLRPNPFHGYYDRPNPDYGQRPNSDDYGRPSKPIKDYLFDKDVDRYDPKPEKPSNYKPEPEKPSDGYNTNNIKGTSKPPHPHMKPIITQSIGSHGESITSIITEIEEACFRRVLAGKRVARAFVKRALLCERIEDCQRECADEKRFVCEGFNYRLDPSGRNKGECELLDIPISRLDIGRDLYPDPDYDYYERDRNAASGNCRGHGSSGYGYGSYYDKRYDYDRWDDHRRGSGHRRPRPDGYDDRPPYDYDDGYRPDGNRRGDFAYHHSHHSDQSYNYHYEHYDHGRPPHDYKPYEPYLPPPRRPDYDDRYFYKNYLDRERDKNYWGFPKPTYGGSYGTNYNVHDFEKKNYYLPPKPGGIKDWGQYGGSYGNGGINLQYNGYGHSQSFDFWGLNKYEEKLPPYKKPLNGESYYPKLPYKPPFSGGSYLPELPYKPPFDGGSYIPEPPLKPHGGGSYVPEPPLKPHGSGGGSYIPDLPPKRPESGLLPPIKGEGGGSYLPEPSLKPHGGSYLPEPPRRPPVNTGSYNKPIHDGDFYNAILPAEPRYPPRHYLDDECSLRSAGGFRLRKNIVKKFYAVPNIYECELLCFKEKDFPCASYAFRYTISSTAPSDNCYLSDRNYKQLDFYTDLQPDRDFDIYTMNNPKRCEQQPAFHAREHSECFWRVRSGQRLDHKVVRDSLTVKSIVECQIECLKATRFTCRAFSFRYGPPVIGGAIDNCQLTDWPSYELDPRAHFIPEYGFELYERGSFGHGCEPDHFGIRGKPWKGPGSKADQLCYVEFGTPAKLLPQATRKEIQVPTEEECKAECSKFRDRTLFQCMSFSFSDNHKWDLNCKLSDILQRDLLPNVDYIPDPHSWLFAWDNYNPECRALVDKPIHGNGGHKPGPGPGLGLRPGGIDRIDYDPYNPIGTWRVYSVSGWPCRRGSLCRENREAGFWFCELEGGDHTTWDYCCRPDHQCGFSQGFQYQWCYVGPKRTQWRQCSDRYYPYVHVIIDRYDPPPRPGFSGGNYLPEHPPPRPGFSGGNYLPEHPPPRPVFSGGNYLPEHPPPPRPDFRPERPPPPRPGFRPDRPPAPPTRPPPRPSLDEYEMLFDEQFLDPPKPGGFGQPRHWPISYLHKEMPPNNTDTEPRLMKAVKQRDPNRKYAAIQNLIDVIKSNDLKNIEYQITNESNKADDILFVKIPLPTNFTQVTKTSEKIMMNTTIETVSESSDSVIETKNATRRSQKSLPIQDRVVPTYRKSYITRTNVTNHSKSRVIRTP